ncbi:MAG: type IX secretion system outer membrane channel protein PorV [Cytophagales bacterium]
MKFHSLKKSIFTSISIFFYSSTIIFAQNSINNTNADVTGRLTEIENGLKPIQTAVPFLTIAPDARGASLGDQGVATTPDEYSAHWNPGKLAQINKDFGVALTYNPWLAKIVDDMSLVYLTGYYKLRKVDAISLSLTYFNLGKITFTDNNGGVVLDYNPREFSAMGTYSRVLGKGFSGGLSLKYIFSDLSGNFSNNAGTQTRPGQAAAADIGFYYNRDLVIDDRDFNIAAGIAITNIGNKISYSSSSRADFIPTTLRLGTVLTHQVDEYNKFSLALQATKLMVPSSEVLYTDTTGGKQRLPYLAAPNKNLVNGMFSSFSDAPFGAQEELREIMYSVGMEYWYDNMFAVRGGYFYEDVQKGGRKYFTVGIGVRYQTVGLDMAYLIATERTNPLAESFRFALSFNFENKTKQLDSVIE